MSSRIIRRFTLPSSIALARTLPFTSSSPIAAFRFSSSKAAAAASTTSRRVLYASLAAGVATAGTLLYSLENSLKAATELELHPPSYPWHHNRFFGSYDHQR